jgi:ArsR family transcriptional regulator
MMEKNISQETDLKKQVKMFKSLAHPFRLRILNILRDGEHPAGYIESQLGLEQPYCSQQLAVLRKAGLVKGHRDGNNVYYKIIDLRLIVVLHIIDDLSKL